MRRETAIQQNDGVDMLPLELCPAKSLCYVYQGVRSSANTPGNAALCEPIDLQSKHLSMNAVPFVNILDLYILKVLRFYILLYLYLTVNFLITPATETFIFR